MTTATRSTDLQWRQIADVLGVPGWQLHLGYTYTQAVGDSPDVWIHAAEINTGHSLIPLFRADLPNIHQLEAVVADEIEEENRQAAFDLSHPDRSEYPYAEHLAPMIQALSALR